MGRSGVGQENTNEPGVQKRGINSPPPAMHCIDAVRRVDGEREGTRCKQVKNNRPKKKVRAHRHPAPAGRTTNTRGEGEGAARSAIMLFFPL